MSAVALDTTPVDLLARFRGQVVATRLPHSKRVYLEISDAGGETWRLVGWEATQSANERGDREGKTVLGATVEDRSGELTVSFSDRSTLTLTPVGDESEDAIEHWEIFTPEGLILAYGPRGRWLLGRADDPDYWVGWAKNIVRL
jgi:hypothetical protein